MTPDETVTTVTAKDAAGKEVVTTNTASGAAETTTVLKAPNGPEVTTTVRTGSAVQSASSDLDRYVAIWSKAIDTQMHFNEMSVKSRQLGLTFVAAALGVAVVLMSQQKDYSIPILDSFALHVAVLILLAAAGAVYLVSILDVGVYHRMLRGAVAFGEEFEELKLKPMLGVQYGMTQAVTLFSRYSDTRFELNGSPRYQPSPKKVTAEQKIKRFYRWTIGGLVAAAVILFAVTCAPRKGANPTQPVSSSPTQPASSSSPKTGP